MVGQVRHRDRECPRDWRPLEAVKVDVPGPDVTVDRCPDCNGVFLDKNELLRITGDGELNKYLRDRVALDADSELVCPHCGGIMDAEFVAGVEVEVCLSCYSLWLDEGELTRLKARENRDDIDITAPKARELRKERQVKERAEKPPVDASKKEKVKHALTAPVRAYDRALTEFVRRYL